MFLERGGVFSAVTESADLAGNEEITQESAQLMLEAILFENANSDELIELVENSRIVDDLIEMGAVTEQSIVRLNKQARTNQLQKVAVFTIAKERNDADLRKLMTVWRMEKNLEDKLFKKYGSEAMRRAKTMVQKNFRQRGNVFAKITDRAQAKVATPAPGGKVKQGKSQVVTPKKR